MTYINNEIDSLFFEITEYIEETDSIILDFQKKLIYKLITEKYESQYIRRQNRINTLKSPFRKVRGILQEILGESFENMEIQEIIDLEHLNYEKDAVNKILNVLSYSACLDYYIYTQKHGLQKANEFWRKKI